MATFLAAGAASCAGYFIGNLATKPRKQKPVLPFVHSHIISQPSHRAVPPAAPPAVLPPPPPVPGQCSLCQSWFQHGQVVVKLYCGHVYHRACMERSCNQQLFEDFRLTCPSCHGMSWVTRFAITQIHKPPEPSIAPVNCPLPVATPVSHSDPPALPPTPVQSATLLTPTTPQPPPPPAPATVQPTTPLLTPPTPQPPPAPAAATVRPATDTAPRAPFTSPTAVHHTQKKKPEDVPVKTKFRVDTPPHRHGGWPSCSRCRCLECSHGGDGNCSTCGKCKCYQCVHLKCKCSCKCVLLFDQKNVASHQ